MRGGQSHPRVGGGAPTPPTCPKSWLQVREVPSNKGPVSAASPVTHTPRTAPARGSTRVLKVKAQAHPQRPAANSLPLTPSPLPQPLDMSRYRKSGGQRADAHISLERATEPRKSAEAGLDTQQEIVLV